MKNTKYKIEREKSMRLFGVSVVAVIYICLFVCLFLFIYLATHLCAHIYLSVFYFFI